MPYQYIYPYFFIFFIIVLGILLYMSHFWWHFKRVRSIVDKNSTFNQRYKKVALEQSTLKEWKWLK